ncbi:MAG: DmsC/YnfH family molybdoenzyme membrane anchor subunit [Pseudomonadota bacterium]
MHPAYSVIFFTTASGAGYGLIVWIALAAIFGALPADVPFTVVSFGLALILISAGLLSSMLHLGRPERAWRAFSQWQTSWLSREGIAAIATFIPIGLLGLAWLADGTATLRVVLLADLAIIGAAVTVWCTGMIYASLTTIPAWSRPLTPWAYMALSLATGGVAYVALACLFGADLQFVGMGTILAIAAAWLVKVFYWSDVDERGPEWTAEAATGLGRFGTVRPLEPPHTQPNFVMREMGYKVARKHAAQLRTLTIGALAIVPAVCLLAILFTGPGGLALLLALVAAVSAAVGVFTERWLFFAEAKHVVNVYYEGGAV